MGKAKKARAHKVKFAQAKRLLSPKDSRLKGVAEKADKEQVRPSSDALRSPQLSFCLLAAGCASHTAVFGLAHCDEQAGGTQQLKQHVQMP